MARHTGLSLPSTDFGSLDDLTLLWMLHRGAPETVRDIAVAWDVVAVALQERGHDLELEHRRLRPSWTGEAADRYATAISALVRATRRVAELAALVRDVMHQSADALEQARAMYAPPPGLDPARDVTGRLAVPPAGAGEPPAPAPGGSATVEGTSPSAATSWRTTGRYA